MISDKVIQELTEMLKEAPNERQVNLPVGSGWYKKNGKQVPYKIYLSILEEGETQVKI